MDPFVLYLVLVIAVSLGLFVVDIFTNWSLSVITIAGRLIDYFRRRKETNR